MRQLLLHSAKGLILHNIGWKIFSLLLAFGLWYAILGEPELVVTVSAPIYYRNLPRELEVPEDVPETVHFELRGPAGRLSPDRVSQSSVSLDMSSIHDPGELTMTIGPDDIRLPSGAVLVRVVPSQLRVNIDRIASKEVDVRVRTTGGPDARVVTQAVSPPRLRITGPEQRVRQIEFAQTDPIDLSAVDGTREFKVHAYVADTHVRFESSPEVKVRLQVERGGQK